MKKIIYLLLLLCPVLLQDCKNSIKKLYQVHEELPDLDIEYVNPKITPESLLRFLDTGIKNDSVKYKVIASNLGDTLGQYIRIIEFKSSPVEAYRISCKGQPCWISSVFNEAFDKYNWISDPSRIQKTEKERIRKRFQSEILDKVP